MLTRLTAGCLVLLVTLAAAGCASASRVTYIPEGGSYAADSLVSALEQADAGPAAKIAAAEVPEVRQAALADLRTYGEDTAMLADTLTSEFPADVAAVPFLVERGTYDAEPAWIVFESWGEPGEMLSYKRVWVFSRSDLSLLGAQSAR